MGVDLHGKMDQSNLVDFLNSSSEVLNQDIET